MTNSCLLFIVLVGLSAIAVDGQTRIEYDFALNFVSHPVGNVNKAVAGSQTITTRIGSAGPSATLTQLGGGAQAVWLSETTAQLGDNWKESGNITFGAAGAVLFRSNGFSGVALGNLPDLNYGCITYDIYDGTGNFQAAFGMMVDMFISTDPTNATAPFSIQAAGHFWVPTVQPGKTSE